MDSLLQNSRTMEVQADLRATLPANRWLISEIISLILVFYFCFITIYPMIIYFYSFLRHKTILKWKNPEQLDKHQIKYQQIISKLFNYNQAIIPHRNSDILDTLHELRTSPFFDDSYKPLYDNLLIHIYKGDTSSLKYSLQALCDVLHN
jgi:hypothetical protein